MGDSWIVDGYQEIRVKVVKNGILSVFVIKNALTTIIVTIFTILVP